MKKKGAWFAAGFILAIVAGHFYSNCRVGKWKAETASWRAAYEEQKLVASNLEAASNKKIEELLEQIGGLQGNIDSLMFANANLESKLEEQGQKTSEAEALADALQSEIQPVLDSNPKVRAAFEAKDAVISSLKVENFTLREQKANDQKIIFSLTEKYEAQVRISAEYKGQLDTTKQLLQKVELRLNLQDKRVSSLQRQAAWKTYGLVGAGIVTLAAILL